MLSRTPPSMLDGEEKPYKYRLESIGQAMSWIKEELVTLKESDKNLTDIFRKLQTDIQEIGDMCTDARHSYRTSRYVANTVEPVNHDLELSFEDSMEPEEPPVLPPVPPTAMAKALRVPQHQLTTSLSANDSLNSGSPEHKLKSSPSTSGNSYNGLEAIDVVSSVSDQPISRYSSVDSGIQFHNEPEVASSNAGGSSLFEEIFSKLGWQQGVAN
eukprot:Em0005g1148a